MTIFEYKVSSPEALEFIFCIRITDDAENNVTTWFHDKKYLHTIPASEVGKIKNIIKASPELFHIPEHLEPNAVLDGEKYSFIFSDGKNAIYFSGFNILDYNRRPRKNATLALRVAREIKEAVLDLNHIRTMIPTRLQHWPKGRKSSGVVKI